MQGLVISQWYSGHIVSASGHSLSFIMFSVEHILEDILMFQNIY